MEIRSKLCQIRFTLVGDSKLIYASWSYHVAYKQVFAFGVHAQRHQLIKRLADQAKSLSFFFLQFEGI